MTTPIDFCYALQGFAEINNLCPTESEWKRIQAMLDEVEFENANEVGPGLMKPANFVRWLSGYIDISEREMLGDTQWQVICDHLQVVFNKVTPDRTEKKDDDISTLMEEIRKKVDEDKDNPWRNPKPPTPPMWPSDQLICSPGPDVACSDTGDAFCANLDESNRSVPPSEK